MSKLLKSILASLILFISPAFAELKATGGGSVQVIDLTFEKRMSRGRLNGCEISYLLGFEDYVYRQGAVTALRGSLNFYGFINAPDKSPAYIFKVTAFDFVEGQYIPAPLDYAYLSNDKASLAGREHVVSQAEDGGLLVGYDALSLADFDLLGVKAFNVTRAGGSSDVSVPIDLLQINADIYQNFAKCSSELLDNIIQKLN